MPNASAKKRDAHPDGITTAGIDVGGKHKGFHAVALTDGKYSGCIASGNERYLAQWCREVRARGIGPRTILHPQSSKPRAAHSQDTPHNPR
jgi:hypothetical protein